LLYWLTNASSLLVLLLFSVNNPNYFSVDFQKIEAEVFTRNVETVSFLLKAPQIFYPINNTLIGGGTSENIIFHSRSQTNFTFPFMLSYQTTLDPQGKILIDLANKCGVNGGTKSNISVNYKITVSSLLSSSTLILKPIFF